MAGRRTEPGRCLASITTSCPQVEKSTECGWWGRSSAEPRASVDLWIRISFYTEFGKLNFCWKLGRKAQRAQKGEKVDSHIMETKEPSVSLSTKASGNSRHHQLRLGHLSQPGCFGCGWARRSKTSVLWASNMGTGVRRRALVRGLRHRGPFSLGLYFYGSSHWIG